MRLRGIRSALVVLALMCAFPSSVFAAHLGVTDPADGEATVSGQPSAPDVSGLDIDYDPAGSITLTVHFYAPLDQIDTSQNYAFYSNFTVGQAQRDITPGGARGYNCSTSAQGDLSGQHHVLDAYSTFYDQATVTGYDGLLQFTRSTAADKRSITITASGSVIAGRDYDCATYILRGRRHGPVENLNTRYDSACDCWYFPRDYDTVGAPRTATDTSPPLYFDGRTPGPLPACDDGIDNDGDYKTDSSSDPACAGNPDGATESEACRDGIDNDNDGKLDLEDPGCVDDPNRLSEVDPAPTATKTYATPRAQRGCKVRVGLRVAPSIDPARLFPFSQVRVTFRGTTKRARAVKRVRTIDLGAQSGSAAITFRRLVPGRYRIEVSYLGDSWRSPSRAAARTLTLGGRNC